MATTDHLLAAAIEARVRMGKAQRALLERHSEFDGALRELHRAEESLGEAVTGLAIIESHAGRLLGETPLGLQACSFCGASPRDVANLIAGPIFSICDGCVTDAVQMIEARDPEASRTFLISTTATADCSFCGKARRETGHLVTASRGGRICDECLDVCVEIMAEDPG